MKGASSSAHLPAPVLGEGAPAAVGNAVPCGGNRFSANATASQRQSKHSQAPTNPSTRSLIRVNPTSYSLKLTTTTGPGAVPSAPARCFGVGAHPGRRRGRLPRGRPRRARRPSTSPSSRRVTYFGVARPAPACPPRSVARRVPVPAAVRVRKETSLPHRGLHDVSRQHDRSFRRPRRVHAGTPFPSLGKKICLFRAAVQQAFAGSQPRLDIRPAGGEHPPPSPWRRPTRARSASTTPLPTTARS